MLHRSFKKVRICNKQNKRNIVIEKIKRKQKLKNDLDALTNGMKNRNIEINHVTIKKKQA